MRSSGRGERRDRQGSELCDGKSKEIQKERGGGEESKGGWHGERESSRGPMQEIKELRLPLPRLRRVQSALKSSATAFRRTKSQFT